MAYKTHPDAAVPPSEFRCEAMTKPAKSTYQVWRQQAHRCIRRATQSRAGRSVCSNHAQLDHITYWQGEVDTFTTKK